MTKPSADFGPAVELAGDPPRAALLFDHACKLQIRTPEALALFFEKRIPSETHQYRHDDTPSCAHSKLWLESGRPGGCAALTARGESLASHRDGRGAPPARRDDREYREYLSEEQRSRRGCIARRMQPDFHHGLSGLPGERMLDDETVGHDATADQMFLDDPLEDRRIARGIPRALGIDDGDWAAFADAEAVRFRAEDAALLRETELFQPALEKVPRGEPAILLAALRSGLVAAEEDVTLGDRDADARRDV